MEIFVFTDPTTNTDHQLKVEYEDHILLHHFDFQLMNTKNQVPHKQLAYRGLPKRTLGALHSIQIHAHQHQTVLHLLRHDLDHALNAYAYPIEPGNGYLVVGKDKYDLRRAHNWVEHELIYNVYKSINDDPNFCVQDEWSIDKTYNAKYLSFCVEIQLFGERIRLRRNYQNAKSSQSQAKKAAILIELRKWCLSKQVELIKSRVPDLKISKQFKSWYAERMAVKTL